MRKTLRQQIEDKCVHFTGLGNERCDKGIIYENVKDFSNRPWKFPCLKNSPFNGGSCSSTRFPTEEEVEKSFTEIQGMSVRTMEVRAIVANHIKEGGEKSGTMECPYCKGKLSYVTSPLNGHMKVYCSCGISFME